MTYDFLVVDDSLTSAPSSPGRCGSRSSPWAPSTRPPTARRPCAPRAVQRGRGLTDINMPVRGGIELIERIRDDDVTADLPILVISTDGSRERGERLRRARRPRAS